MWWLLLACAGRGPAPSGELELEPLCPAARSHGLDLSGVPEVDRPTGWLEPALTVRLGTEEVVFPDEDPAGPAAVMVPSDTPEFIELRVQLVQQEPPGGGDTGFEDTGLDLGAGDALPALAKGLARHRQAATRLGAGLDVGFRGRVNLVIEGEVLASRLVAALHTLHDQGFPELHLVLRSGQGQVPAWADPIVAGALEAGAPLEWPHTCPSGRELGELIASTPIELAPPLVTEALDENLEPCSERDRLQVLTNVQWMLCEAQPISVVALELDPEAEVVQLRPDASWAEIAPAWVQLDGGALWVALE